MFLDRFPGGEAYQRLVKDQRPVDLRQAVARRFRAEAADGFDQTGLEEVHTGLVSGNSRKDIN